MLAKCRLGSQLLSNQKVWHGVSYELTMVAALDMCLSLSPRPPCNRLVNPLKRSGVIWLHFKVFNAIHV